MLLGVDERRRSIVSPSGVRLAESGLEGLEIPICLGGCGNAPMLTVFRSVLPAGSGPAGPSSACKVGTDGEFVCFAPARYGNAEEETARFAVAGLGSIELRRGPGLLEPLDLATGNDGRGPVGGAIEGLEGRGSELVDMFVSRCKLESRSAGV